MDKKSLFIGVICLCVAFGLMIKQSALSPKGTAATQTESIPEGTKAHPLGDILPHSIGDIGAEIRETSAEKPADYTFDGQRFVTLENEAMSVRLSTIGAGIQDIALKKYPAVRGQEKRFIFNENMPLPSLVLAFGSAEKLLLANYEISSQTAQRVIFRKEMQSGIVVEREYRLAEGDMPYILATQLRCVNGTEKAYDLGDIFVGLGSFPPTASDVLGDYLNFGYYDGKKAHFIAVNDFRAKSGFLGMGKAPAKNRIMGDDKVVWGAVKNQFFTGVFTPKVPGNGFVALPNEVFDASSERMNDSVVGSIRFPLGRINPGETKVLEGDFYVGPKDYVLLDRLGQDQDLVMQFGFFGFISKLLFLLMKGIYALVGNWGLTIIILTIIVKFLLWPLTTAQVRSSRKMARLQEPLKKIKEKYRENPQKLQAETLKLFRENRVNPAAGCLPIFIQLPIFLGLYFMLKTTADMRFAPFLWIGVLSLPDTIFRLGSFPVNLLPLLMSASMLWQMRVMPMPSADGAQKWVFKLMPLLCLVFCYNFPSALVLYWTIQNLLTIAQQIILNRKDDEALLIDDSEKIVKKKKK
ncbi:MAG: membrane protein insertase YidC [Puniceicoccales bacterium]|jgi:YidC/Oxa1 family membrane protein insertase|nr:membrane protein insertase YidC [Puniceicoccales bacterium]